jgi:uncharacterized peroxidase-related enzyme
MRPPRRVSISGNSFCARKYEQTGPPVTKPPISRYPTPELADLPQDIRERIEAVQEKSGFVPNVFLALARRPDEFRAFFAYHDTLMEKQGGLTKAEREMIVVATSGVNACTYCVVAHGAILRIRAKNPLIADQVAVNYRKADLAPKHKAMLDFAVTVAERSHAIDDADYEQLKRHGFSDEDAWDIAAIAAMFAMSNRLANAFSIRANDEFYMMGREIRAEQGSRSARAITSARTNTLLFCAHFGQRFRDEFYVIGRSVGS